MILPAKTTMTALGAVLGLLRLWAHWTWMMYISLSKEEKVRRVRQDGRNVCGWRIAFDEQAKSSQIMKDQTTTIIRLTWVLAVLTLFLFFFTAYLTIDAYQSSKNEDFTGEHPAKQDTPDSQIQVDRHNKFRSNHLRVLYLPHTGQSPCVCVHPEYSPSSSLIPLHVTLLCSLHPLYHSSLAFA